MLQEVFYSKVDAFFMVAIGLAWLVCIGVILLVYRQIKARFIVFLVTLPTTALLFPLPLWILLTTKYTIIGSTLNIHSGPVNFDIDIKSIQSITPTRNGRSSPALSLDRLEITYGDGRSVLVSPKDPVLFVKRLDAIKGGSE